MTSAPATCARWSTRTSASSASSIGCWIGRPTSGRSSCSRPTRAHSRNATTPTSGDSTGGRATAEEFEEKFGILSAYHLPGVDPEAAGLYPDITPVNSFRVVFDTYFGADLGLLPDLVFAHVSQQDFYEFFDVTELLRPE